MNLNEIISGDRILSLCDFVIIIPSTFNFHKNILNFVNYENLIFIHDFNNININDINSTLKKSNKTHINLFIYNYLIDDFIKFVLEHLDKNLTFTIYLHNGDETFGHKNLHENLIFNPQIKKIYAQNLNYYQDNAKLKLLPIGIANSMWEHGNLPLLYDIMIKDNKKNKNVYINLNTQTFKYRAEVYKYLNQYNIETINNRSNHDYLKDLAEHRFCLCVRGNGIDTHRFYESLCLKVIPIIINNSSTDMNSFVNYLKKLNIPFFEITEEDLDTIINKYFLTDFFNQDFYNNIMNKYPDYMQNLKLDFYK